MKKEILTVVFDRKKTLAKTGEGKVEICIYFNRVERKFVTIKTCSEALWTRYKKSRELKKELQIYQEVIERMQKNREQMTIETLNSYMGLSTDRKQDDLELKRLSMSADGFIDFMRSCIAKEKLARSTEKHKYGTIEAIIRFGRLSRFNQLTPNNIVAFDDFLHGESDRKICTIFSYHKVVKVYTKLAFQFGYIPADPYDHPLCHFDHGKYAERKPLSEEELLKIRSLEHLTSKEEKVRDLFVFCAYTGLAYIDSQKFDFNTMTEEVNGTTYIDGRRVKTGNTYYTPILPPAMEVLEKYNYQLPHISNQKANDYLHVIESRCNLNKSLTTHVARHSFATLVLSYDIPIENVARMLGHSNIRTTQIYSKILKSTIERHTEALIAKIQ